METIQGGVPPYGVKETLVVNGKSESSKIATTTKQLMDGEMEGTRKKGWRWAWTRSSVPRRGRGEQQNRYR